jgi:periplasmic divalent cation tolerance protein
MKSSSAAPPHSLDSPYQTESPATVKTTSHVVLVTAPDINAARTLARAALEARLVACANLVPRLESHYWWQGRIETSREVLLLFKTIRSRLPALERLISRSHPYDNPEFIAVPIAHGSKRYLNWIRASTSPET